MRAQYGQKEQAWSLKLYLRHPRLSHLSWSCTGLSLSLPLSSAAQQVGATTTLPRNRATPIRQLPLCLTSSSRRALPQPPYCQVYQKQECAIGCSMLRRLRIRSRASTRRWASRKKQVIPVWNVFGPNPHSSALHVVDLPHATYSGSLIAFLGLLLLLFHERFHGFIGGSRLSSHVGRGILAPRQGTE